MTAVVVTQASGANGVIQISDSAGSFSSNPKLVFNQSTEMLGIGTASPTHKVHIVGNMSVTGTLYATRYYSTVVSSSILYESGSSKFGNSTDDVHQFTGSAMFKSGMSGSLTNLSDGKSYLVAGSGLSISSASNGQVTLSSNIGAAEEGSYTDGLFTDFTSTTTIGTAVDRFNEILKALSPSPAPDLDDIGCADTGQGGKLSFGSSNAISGYTNVTSIGNNSAVDMNGSYSVAAASNDLRRGLFSKSTVINGTLNDDISADGINYGADAFGDGKTGFVILQLNGSDILSASISVDNNQIITSSAGGSSLTIYSADQATFDDGTHLDVFMHRSGAYSISTSDQNNGLNYVRVIHRKASSMSDTSSDITTNYVEWVNDNDSNALAATANALDTLSMSGDKRLSGVKYHTGGSAQYRVRVTNAYRNVYTTSNITFTDTNCTISAQAMPSIGGGEDETKTLHITGSATINANSLLNQSISAAVNVSHPLKSNLSSGGSSSISGLLLWGYSNNSTVVRENFRAENYRIISGSYDTQASAVHSDNTWDSSKHMSGSNTGYADGLMFYNSRLYSPSQGANSGNFSGISNGPSDNVNYSGITSGQRTFYRYYQNNSGGSKTGFSLTINGSGTIVSSSTALNSSRIRVFVKLPTTSGSQATGGMDLAVAFSTGQISDNDGCLEGSLDSSLNATNTATFGTQFVADDEYICIRVEADASFTGYISQMTVSWS